MTTSANFDFGGFFSDFLTKNANSSTTPNTSTDYSDTAEADYDYDKDWEKEYNELKSEFDSYRKRVQNTLETEKQLLKKNLLKNFLSEFVVFMINTYKGKKNVDNSITDADYLILKKMNDFLDSMGVIPMEDCTGKEFDYKTMEAIVQEPNSGYPHNTVTKVIYNGFMLNDEVLLPQKVSVSS